MDKKVSLKRPSVSFNSSILRPFSEIRRNDGGKLALSNAQGVAETR